MAKLAGRNFKREELAKTAPSLKRHILGEYTVELHDREQMFQLRLTKRRWAWRDLGWATWLLRAIWQSTPGAHDHR
jgi:hypothetical protein